MNPLVSVIIPCYNAAQWLTESIDSALNQTYPNIEVIVVDDGSTDGSHEILQRYEDRIRVEYRLHLGGCAARNHGFAVSQGEYIQYLDADDYILPEKVERQVRFLQESDQDVVYSDWRYQFHESNGRLRLGPIAPPPHIEFMEYLLSGMAIPHCAMLWQRRCFKHADGWDETLEAAQDVDFVLAIALSGATFQYQPGCYFIYRKYGEVTVSTANPHRILSSAHRIYQKYRNLVRNSGQMNDKYHQALATWHFNIARRHFSYDRNQYNLLIQQLQEFAPAFVPNHSRIYKSAWKIGGYEFADFIAEFLRPVYIRLRAML